MTTLKVHNLETAPDGSKALLEQSLKSNGVIPGLHGYWPEHQEFLRLTRHCINCFRNPRSTKKNQQLYGRQLM